MAAAAKATTWRVHKKVAHGTIDSRQLPFFAFARDALCRGSVLLTRLQVSVTEFVQKGVSLLGDIQCSCPRNQVVSPLVSRKIVDAQPRLTT